MLRKLLCTILLGLLWLGGDAGANYGRVCFYRGVNYSADSFCLGDGQSLDNLAHYGNWNDQINSIYVESGLNVYICTDATFRGACTTINGSIDDLGRLGPMWRYSISSLRISGGYYPPPPSGYGSACFYRHGNFGGDSFCLNPGQEISNLSQYGNWNDQISSFTVDGNLTVLVCTDTYFRGSCQNFNQSVYNMAQMGGWNDNVSSIRVVQGYQPPPPPPPSGQACFYEGQNFSGQYFCMNQGNQANNLGGTAWNDRIGSVRTFGYVNVYVCRDKNFGGGCMNLNNSVPDLMAYGPQWFRQISSINVR